MNILQLACCFLLISLTLSAKPASAPGEYNYCHAPPVTVHNPQTNQMQLQLVQVLTRHGDRTPVRPLQYKVSESVPPVWQCNLTNYDLYDESFGYSSNIQRIYRTRFLPGRETLPGNCYSGQLTTVGASQHIELGQAFRQRYIHDLRFLPSQLNISDVFIRSTDIPRTFYSVQANFHGLYPPETRQSGQTVLDIFTIESYTDDMTPNSDLCPAVGAILSKRYAEFATNHVGPFSTWISKMQSIFHTTDFVSTLEVLDNMNARYCHGKPFPVGYTLDLMKEGNVVMTAVNAYVYNTTQFRQLSMGPLLAELTNVMKAKIAGNVMPKYLYYSGHDTTLMPLLNTLSLWLPQNSPDPQYASHIEMELWKDSQSNYFVALNYNGQSLQIPGCSSSLCSMTEYLKAIADVLPPPNYAEVCQSAPTPSQHARIAKIFV